jgi:hypothetical protein
MQHGETQYGAEPFGSERQPGSVCLNHRHIFIPHAARDFSGEGRVDFKTSQAVHSPSNDVCGEAETWADLQNIAPEIEAIERPRQELRFNGMPPVAGTADPAMEQIHGVFLRSYRMGVIGDVPVE